MAWIGLGSNLGDRTAHLGAMVRKLGAHPRLAVVKVSPIWKSAPARYRRQPWFFNAALQVRAGLSPTALLGKIQAVERSLGRKPGRRYGPRVADLDLLLYGANVLATRRLTVPHREMARRAFVLAPLVALSPRLRHPVHGVPLATLLRRAPGKAVRLPPAEQRRFRRLCRSAGHE